MPRGTTFRTWDDYFIPGTSVLRNKFTAPGKPYGEPDPDKLRTMEEGAAAFRLEELRQHPIAGRFDYDHMKAIHGAIFQDVYDWAGVPRVGPDTPMSKDGPNVLDPSSTELIAYRYYPGGEPMNEAAEAQYAKLAGKDLLRGLPEAEFVDELAETWGEVNVIHSFREGNTRSQFVFFSQLAEQAGYRIDPAQFAPGAPLRDEFVRARFHGQATGRNDRLAAVLGKAIAPFESAPRDTPPGAVSRSPLWQASYPGSAADATRPVAPPTARGGSGTTAGRAYGAGQEGRG
ncbi:MAG: cell filamentation protein Fic [Microbacterium sp. 69-7]|uniref:Fic/DOC family protein n=1 Tax=Microbacterium sp. 69-7 TaxID=1895784 RepID=UPI00095FD864|nr:Fic family protein [Microbacterium sp. 69-7]OJU45368.1 MAG: cell filamentation protein Fic [Microbacterium sp. 69-7]